VYRPPSEAAAFFLLKCSARFHANHTPWPRSRFSNFYFPFPPIVIPTGAPASFAGAQRRNRSNLSTYQERFPDLRSLIPDPFFLITAIFLVYTRTNTSLHGGPLLPSSKFPRLAIAAAILIAILLILDLQFVHSAAKGLLFSNALDLSMLLLAAISSFYIARRSSGYARQLWTLLAIALSLESIAQAISTYYQSFVPGSAQIPWPSDLLFFVWAAPVFMMFLPASDDDASPSFDLLRILDFLQVAIVAATVYLYFFYVPSRWQSGQASLLRQILVLFIVRDFLLSTGFFVRAKTSLSPWLRYFSVAMALVFLTAVLSDADYLFTLGTFSGGASWGDFVSALPYLLVVIFAATWKRAADGPVHEPHSRFVDFVVTHVLPTGIPILVILMGRRIAKEQFLIAWVAITASVLCSAFRLILTNRKQQRIARQLSSTELALQRSEQVFASAFRWSPDSFSINVFPNGPYLDVNEGFIRLTGYSREETLGRTPSDMNLWIDPSERGRILAQLKEKDQVREQEFHFRTKSGDIRSGQMSAVVTELNGRACTFVVVRDITARIEAENILRDNEERFRSLVENLHVGIVLCGPDSTILFANQAASEIFRYPAHRIVGKVAGELDLIPLAADGTILPKESRPLARVIATGQPVYGQMVGYRVPHFQEILWTLLDAIPEFDANGTLRRVILSFTDLTEMKNAERAIHQLTTQLLQLQDEERRRIGRELHDGLAQTVLAVNLSLAQVRQSIAPLNESAEKSLLKARALMGQMSREIRTLSFLLHPPLLDELGLVSALKEYILGFSERSGIDTQFYLLSDFARLPQSVETALFRVVQESLTNIQRHSGSSSAKIRLRRESSTVILEVTDFGHGMPTRSNGSRQSGEVRLGVGVPGMHERMSQLGGRLEIDSSSSGTTVRATIPLTGIPATEPLDDRASHPHRG
jgi:PAS domain S-box-containing protein